MLSITIILITDVLKIVKVNQCKKYNSVSFIQFQNAIFLQRDGKQSIVVLIHTNVELTITFWDDQNVIVNLYLIKETYEVF